VHVEAKRFRSPPFFLARVTFSHLHANIITPGRGAFWGRVTLNLQFGSPTKHGCLTTFLPSDLIFQPLSICLPREPKARRCPAPATAANTKHRASRVIRPVIRSSTWLPHWTKGPKGKPHYMSTGPLTKCRYPFACSIIAALKHQSKPAINLDPVCIRDRLGISGSRNPPRQRLFQKAANYVR